MAGLTGVFMRGDERADVASVRRMADACACRAIDGTWQWHAGPFAAARQQTFCTPEDALERGPVLSVATGTTLVFDGRLDNRGGLASCLGISPTELGGMPDAHLALRAWLRWHDETPAHLLGDFVFVAWESAAREVFCATDPFGVRPLHYFLCDRAFIFATELAQLVAHPLVPRAPDERAIGELLAVDLRSPGLTLYKNVRRLPHGHQLHVTPTSERLARYWLPRTQPISRRTDVEYVEEFRDMFDCAVAARLRSIGPVGAHLSGGLDSSSVVVSAARMNPRPDLAAFSLAFEAPAEADERTYIRAVLQHSGVAAVVLRPPPFDPVEVRAQVKRRGYLPDFPNMLAARPLRQAMRARGIRVSLTGSGGDLGLAGSYFYYADLLRQGRLFSFARRYRDVATSPGHAWQRAELVRGAVWPLLPGTARRFLRPLARRVSGLSVPDWIDPAFARRAGLFDLPLPETDRARNSHANTTIAAAYDGGLMHLVHDLYEAGSSDAGLYDRHPFLDRRLVEFLIALPDDLRWRNRRTKFVLREAMRTRLPEIVRDRPDHAKSDFSHLTAHALEGLGGRRFFERMSIEHAGFVVRGSLAALHDRMRRLYAARDSRFADIGWYLWTAAATELWFSATFAPAAARSILWSTRATTTARVENGRRDGRIANATSGPS